MPLEQDVMVEPMFCFERALKLLYFSALAYDIEEVFGLGPLPLEAPSCILPISSPLAGGRRSGSLRSAILLARGP